MPTYSVINPTIVGSLNTSFDASSPLQAANSFFNEMTSNKLFYGPAESFYFTMKDNNNKLFNFHVEELPSSSSKNVNYKLTKAKDFSGGDAPKILSHFNDELNNVSKLIDNTTGGKHLKLDDSSSDDKIPSLSYLKKDSSSSSDDDDGYLSRILRSRNYSYPYGPVRYFGYDPTIYIAKDLPNVITMPSLAFPYTITRPYIFYGPGGYIQRIY